MKCVCRRKCFLKDDDYGFDRLQEQGVIRNFKVCPEHFEPLEEAQKSVDFRTAPEELLEEAKFELQLLRDFLKSEFNLTVSPSAKKSTLIVRLIEARGRPTNKDVLADVKGIIL